MIIKGSCHCKATQFEVAYVPETVTRCTCSICSKRGGLWAYYKPTDVRFISDNAKSSYEWRKGLQDQFLCRLRLLHL
jgi:hypothetical protein